LTDRDKLLGEGNIINLLLKFSIPAIVGMLVNALYNVVDRIFIGQGVGSLGIAGITIGFPIMSAMMSFGMLIGLGSTSLISIRLGERKKEEAELIVANAMMLLIVVSLLLAIIGLIFLNPLLRFFGASENVLPYASEYLRIILYGSLFSGIGFGMNNLIRGEGNPRYAMFSMLIGAIANTILDPIFIFVFGWGIMGAALATIISQALSAVWVMFYFLSGRSMLKIRLKNLRFNRDIIIKIIAIGSAPFAIQIAASILTVILNNSLLHYGGDVAISAMGIINSISLLILMPVFGINQGAQPIIGYNYGAKKFDRVKQTLKLAIFAATFIVVVGFIISRVFPQQLIRMFNNKDEELVRIGVRGLQIFLAFLPIVGFQIVSANYFQAVGRPKHAMFLSLSRQVTLLIPAVLILPRFFQLDGVFMAGPVSDLGSSILTGIWIFREIRHLDKRHLEALTPEVVGE
jgi:putative MATE family efflux protein